MSGDFRVLGCFPFLSHSTAPDHSLKALAAQYQCNLVSLEILTRAVTGKKLPPITSTGKFQLPLKFLRFPKMLKNEDPHPEGYPLKTHHVHTLHSTLKGRITFASLSGDCTNVNRSGALLCCGTLNLIQNESKGQGPRPRPRLPPRKSSAAPTALLHWFQIKEHLTLSLHWMFYCCCRFINW